MTTTARELFRLIDWMMHLRDDLSERFRRDLDQLEEQLTMPYVTSVERLAKAEGKAEGKAAVILAVLRRECDELPEELQQRIRQLSLDELDQLQEQMFEFRAAASVLAWLESLPNE